MCAHFSLFSVLLKVVASIESESGKVESLSVSVNQIIARTVGHTRQGILILLLLGPWKYINKRGYKG